MIFRIVRALVFGLALASAPVMALAQTAGQQAEVLAKISLETGKAVQTDRSVAVTFSVKNGGAPTSGIKTSVILLSSDLSSVVDEAPIEGDIALGAGDKKEISYTYAAPKSLSGAYRVGVRAQTAANFPLGTLIIPGNITLSAPTDGVFIDQSSCYLKVAGETADKRYTLEGGVAVKPTEKLSLSCSVKNFSADPVQVKSYFDTYLRSRSGPLSSANVAGEDYMLRSSETKRIDLPLTLPAIPQAYDIIARLAPMSGEASNDVRAHIVVYGPSATIQSFSLDKTAYKKGDQAEATLVWTPSADSFPDSRLGDGTKLVAAQAVVSLRSGDKSCGPDLKVPLLATSFTIIRSMTIDSACSPISAHVSIADGERELASADYAMPLPPEEDSQGMLVAIAVATVALFALLIALLVKLFKSKGKGIPPATIPPAAALAIAFIIGLGFAHPASADTVTWTDKGGNTLTGTINMQSVWNEGDSIGFSGDFSNTYQWCSNGAKRTITYAYEIHDSQDRIVNSGHAINGPYFDRSVGALPPGNYVLKSYFGDSVEQRIDHYEDGTCLDYSTYAENYGENGIEEVTPPTPYTCPVPVYVSVGTTGLATAEMPFSVVAVDKSPTGFVDAADCNAISGWAFDSDSPNTSVTVHLYKDGPAGSGQIVGGYRADSDRPDVDAVYGISGAHGFSIPTPDSLKTGSDVTVYLYGIGVNSSGQEDGMNSALSNMPRTFRCDPPAVTPTDMCVNIGGVQPSVPADRIQSGQNCVCPPGATENGAGQCVSPAAPAQCADGTDNDGDGLTDMSDPGCSSIYDNDETNAGTDDNNNGNVGNVDNGGGGGNGGGNGGALSGFTISGQTRLPIRFIAQSPAMSQPGNVSVNPVSGFSAPVTLSVESIRSASGASLPDDVSPTYYFGGAESSSALMSYNPAYDQYVNTGGLIGTTFSVRLSKPIAEKYYVTIRGISGALTTTHVVEIDPTATAPEYKEL
ncbi:MAG TPA: hypothetical protein VHD69_00475 [Candidatus Paceibacterota bacterium]|nr:hypothetical protein [Candidatus Paceibacterota bacterium]